MKTYKIHTLVLGSGAAGLNAALQLKRRGIDDILVVTESLHGGTSINTGSDKQTYYKMGLYGAAEDSPRSMAETFFAGGSMDGDTALVEAALSTRAFYNLLELGVPFPEDRFGQFPGYKTDHDPRQRATSIGPYTSREMCRKLITELKRLEVPITENRVAVRLVCSDTDQGKRIGGLFCVNLGEPIDSCLEFYLFENMVFSVGGPGGLYRDSVYPNVHTGGIGLALEVGATAQNLTESQFGLASTKFRWNVSGTYMQVIPRFISTDQDGHDSREFLLTFFESPEKMFTAVFLKGYQWPFDTTKLAGSSLIDLLVYQETVIRKRRVFLDYRENTPGLDFECLEPEVRNYLEKSQALFGTPFERLVHMNPIAVELYKNHGIDLAGEPLEIALCAQHNNGGLAVNHWWESVNRKHFFVAGEAAGTHGVARPGGSALNSGQVAGFRIAEYIVGKYADRTVDQAALLEQASRIASQLYQEFDENWRSERSILQARMSDFASAVVTLEKLESASCEAWDQVRKTATRSGNTANSLDLAESLRTKSLCLAHAVYIDAILEMVRQGCGSRGSRLVLDSQGKTISDRLDDSWRFAEENRTLREMILETCISGAENEKSVHHLRPCRPIPDSDAWFEVAWNEFREGKHLL